MTPNNLIITAKLIVERQVCSSSLIQEELQFEEHYANDVIDYLEGLSIIAQSSGMKSREVLFKSIEELDKHLRHLFPDNSHIIEDILAIPDDKIELIDYGIPRPEKPPVDYLKNYVSLLVNTTKFRGFTVSDDVVELSKKFFVEMIKRGDKLGAFADFVEALMTNCERRDECITDKVITIEDVETTILIFMH